MLLSCSQRQGIIATIGDQQITLDDVQLRLLHNLKKEGRSIPPGNELKKLHDKALLELIDVPEGEGDDSFGYGLKGIIIC